MQGSDLSHRMEGSLKRKGHFVLCLGSLAILLWAAVLFWFFSHTRLDTQGWNVNDFLEHLNKQGVQLRVIHGHGRVNYAYLTEDEDLTWEAMHEAPADPQYIAQWQGTVVVSYDFLGSDGDNQTEQWGKNGCQIGNFVLFGDERLLRRIQKACRWHRG